MQKPEWGIGERNEGNKDGNAENQGGNVGNQSDLL